MQAIKDVACATVDSERSKLQIFRRKGCAEEISLEVTDFIIARK